MTADMKAAMGQLIKLREQWSGEHHHGLTFGNIKDLVEQFAAAFLELQADLEKFRQAEIRWMDEAAAKDAELERERKARRDAERDRDLLGTAVGTGCLPKDSAIKDEITQRRARRAAAQHDAEQRAADLRERLDRVEVDVMAFLETEYPMTRRPLQAAIRKVIRALASSPPAGGQTETAAAQSEQSVQAPSGGQPQESATAAAPRTHLYFKSNAAAGQESNGRGNTQAGEAEQSVSAPAPSAAPDAALPGLELAAKICDALVTPAEAIRAEIERRRSGK